LQRAGLFAEAGLNLYYLIMSIYGWYIWHRRSNEAPLAISRTNASQWLIVAGIVLLGGGVQYAILHFFTESTVPLWDAFVSATAWAGMWLLARRKLENWILLNISNFAAIPLLFIKNLPLTGLLTLFLFFVAFQGYYSWKKEVHS
jgi:nicotinamide mononucleotide transporter